MGAVIAPLTLLGGPLMVRAAWYTAGIVGGLSTVAMCAPSEKFLNMGGPLAVGFGVIFASSLGKCSALCIGSTLLYFYQIAVWMYEWNCMNVSVQFEFLCNVSWSKTNLLKEMLHTSVLGRIKWWKLVKSKYLNCILLNDPCYSHCWSFYLSQDRCSCRPPRLLAQGCTLWPCTEACCCSACSSSMIHRRSSRRQRRTQSTPCRNMIP